MARVKKVKRINLKLTEEQLKKIAGVFGADFAKRIQGLEVDQLAGFLRANMKVN